MQSRLGLLFNRLLAQVRSQSAILNANVGLDTNRRYNRIGPNMPTSY